MRKELILLNAKRDIFTNHPNNITILKLKYLENPFLNSIINYQGFIEIRLIFLFHGIKI